MAFKIIVLAFFVAFANARIIREASAVPAPASHPQPVAYASPVFSQETPVLQAYSAARAFPAPQSSFVSAYSAPFTPQVALPYSASLAYSTPLAPQYSLRYSAPLSHSAPLIYSGPQSAYAPAYTRPVLAANSVSPLTYAAQAPFPSAYSSPVVAESVGPIKYIAQAPGLSAYSTPFEAERVGLFGYPTQASVGSAYSSPIVPRTYGAGPFVSSSALSFPLYSPYSGGPVS